MLVESVTSQILFHIDNFIMKILIILLEWN